MSTSTFAAGLLRYHSSGAGIYFWELRHLDQSWGLLDCAEQGGAKARLECIKPEVVNTNVRALPNSECISLFLVF